jgi:hypothetical protein
MSKIHNEDDEGKPPPGAFPLLIAWRASLGSPVRHRAPPVESTPARLDLLRLVADVRTRHGQTTVWLVDGRCAVAATWAAAIDALLERGAAR